MIGRNVATAAVAPHHVRALDAVPVTLPGFRSVPCLFPTHTFPIHTFPIHTKCPKE